MKDKVKPLTGKEIELLDDMKGNCLIGSKYKDEKAKDKFYMLCHLEDFVIKHDDLQQENKQLKERIDKAIEHLELKQMRYLNEPDYRICTLDLEEIKDILKGRGLMNKLEVGMYVRTKCGYICKIININDLREPSMKYGVEASYLKDIMFIGDDDISKASHSLLGNNEEPCLIEEDDYVNGDIVTKIKEDKQNNKYIVTIFNDIYHNENIKSIVTKEQFEAMSYKVGDSNE